MLDGHIHLEQGPYTLAWVQKFIEQAQRMGLDEIWSTAIAFENLRRSIARSRPPAGRSPSGSPARRGAVIWRNIRLLWRG